MYSVIRFFKDAFNGSTDMSDYIIKQNDETLTKTNNVSDFIDKLIDHVFVNNINLKYKYIENSLFKILGLNYPIYIRILDDKFQMLIIFPPKVNNKNILSKIIISFDIKTDTFSLYINDKNCYHNLTVGITTTVYSVFRKFFLKHDALLHKK
jgi:hypothetical protein